MITFIGYPNTVSLLFEFVEGAGGKMGDDSGPLSNKSFKVNLSVLSFLANVAVSIVLTTCCA